MSNLGAFFAEYRKKPGFAGLRTSRSGLSTPRCFVPRLNPFNPLRTNRRQLRWTGSRPPLKLIFVVPCSGGSPRHLNTTTRFACRLGRQSLAHEPTAATHCRGSAHPDFRGGGLRARNRADPCKIGFIEAAHRAIAIQTNVPHRAPIPRARVAKRFRRKDRRRFVTPPTHGRPTPLTGVVNDGVHSFTFVTFDDKLKKPSNDAN
jgi:hypothetical protein